MIDLALQSDRRKLIEEIKSNENKDRKARSFKQSEIFKDKLNQYVIDYLKTQFNEKTVMEMPVISCLNATRRVIKQQASLYKKSPGRMFIGASEDQVEVLNKLYQDMNFDSQMQKANECYKLQLQTHLQIIPKKGRLYSRVLKLHNIDVLPDVENPEEAYAYIISGFDKHEYERDQKLAYTPTSYRGTTDQYRQSQSDGVDQEIADQDDNREASERYVVWTSEYNFTMNGRGEIISEDTDNLIDEASVIEIVKESDKDFEYYVREGDILNEFTIQFNGEMSDVAQVVRMQGWAQAYLKAPADLIPENLQIGPNFIVKLPVDPDNPVDTEFGYANPGSDVGGALDFIDRFVDYFIATRGLEQETLKAVEGKQFGSGYERFLYLIQKFEPSKEDISLFEKVEQDAFELIKKWHNSLLDSDLLDDEYKTAMLGDDITLAVKFASPEMERTEKETIEVYSQKREEGVASRVDMIMELENIESREDAIERIKDIDTEEGIFGKGEGISLGEGRNIPDIQDERPDKEEGNEATE